MPIDRESIDDDYTPVLPKAQDAHPLEAYLRGHLSHAEWRDKHIYVVDGPNLQHWKIDVYLPVPLDAADKSPEAAFDHLLNQLNRRR